MKGYQKLTFRVPEARDPMGISGSLAVNGFSVGIDFERSTGTLFIPDSRVQDVRTLLTQIGILDVKDGDGKEW